MSFDFQEKELRKATFARVFITIFVFGSVLLVISHPSSPRQSGENELRFAPAAGTRLNYQISGMINMDGEGILGNDLALTAVSEGELRFYVQTSTRDTVRARLTSPGLDINVRLPDRTVTETLRTKQGEALEIVFNRTGKVQEIRHGEALSQKKILNFSIPQIITDYFPLFPVNPVAPGDTWTESRRTVVPFQGFDIQVNLNIEYTLNEILPTPEGRKGLISAVYRVTVSGQRDLGDSVGVFEGSGTGAGFLHFLIDRGFFTAYRVDYQTNAAFVVKKGEERLLELPFAFSVYADLELTGQTEP
jgi:hypothetical protein